MKYIIFQINHGQLKCFIEITVGSKRTSFEMHHYINHCHFPCYAIFGKVFFFFFVIHEVIVKESIFSLLYLWWLYVCLQTFLQEFQLLFFLNQTLNRRKYTWDLWAFVITSMHQFSFLSPCYAFDMWRFSLCYA